MGRFGLILILTFAFATCLNAATTGRVYTEEEEYDRRMHPGLSPTKARSSRQQQPEHEDAQFWIDDAQSKLRNKLSQKYIEGEARNVIFYLGDGMSVPTITASRVFKGQKVDGLPFGEEGELYFDSFPWTGVSKTFCSDGQVADSACSATAYLCGTKANDGTMGVTNKVKRRSCELQADADNHVDSIMVWAQAAGKSTGIVTTTRVTHASPGGAYAHIANRDWENDDRVSQDGGNPEICPDIAQQLILQEPGNKFNVILGGGRLQFVPSTVPDPETNQPGYRRDGKNLIESWIGGKNPTNSKYVTTKEQLLAIDVNSTDYLLGLFAPGHVGYLDQQEADYDPSLEDMVDVAISILSKNPKGFFLFVEGGRIDHAHHDNFIQRSLWETIEFDKAIKKGDDMTDDQETLIVITSDHAHVMHFAGYPERGTDILEYSRNHVGNDFLRYNTLGYGNGPSQTKMFNETCHRVDITTQDLASVTYQPPVPVPNDSETHGGDDVLIFSKGPYGHLLTGVQQQSYIPHVVAFAACVGSGETHCRWTSEAPSSTTPQTPPSSTTPQTSPSPTTPNDEDDESSTTESAGNSHLKFIPTVLSVILLISSIFNSL